jgi:lipoprotein signal peptidase
MRSQELVGKTKLLYSWVIAVIAVVFLRKNPKEKGLAVWSISTIMAAAVGGFHGA